MSRSRSRRAERRRRGRGRVIGGSAAVLAALLVGYTALDAVDAVPGVLTIEPTSGGTPAPKVTGAPPRAEKIGALDPSAPVPKDIGPIVDAAFKDKAFKGRAGIDIRDAATGDVLYSKDSETSRTPASVTKVLTSAAALGGLGADHTFKTTARLDSWAGSGGTLALVGGGDVMLGKGKSNPDVVDGRAGLGTLAEETAHELKKHEIDSVDVYADVSRYSGPRFSRDWERSDIGLGFITNIEPLMVNTGSKTGKHIGPRSPEPARDALNVYVDALKKNGIKAEALDKAPPAPADEQPDPITLAQVESAPVSSLVRHTMQMSDNIVAETLGREVAISRGESGSERAAATSVPAQLSDMGIDTGTITLHDTSGLSYRNRISPHDLTDIVAAAAQSDGSLSQLIPAMPVGGLNGTLVHRYTEKGVAGEVSAKTGTLRTVASLAGTITTADGRLLVFSMMTDHNPEAAVGGARLVMDKAVSDIVACGCS